ncbi:MAG: patatin-like phospholipase family protein [Desulfitobacteriia bacterium]|jgi:NTE family protein
MEKKIGLVLAGGGGKGAYQIGVWKALKEFGVDKNITAVSGSSVGALNAVLFAQGDYELAENIWLNISTEDILNFDVEKLIGVLPNILRTTPIIYFLKNHGFFSRKGLLKILDTSINFHLISGLDLYACCSDITKFPPSIREVDALVHWAAGKKFGSETYFNLGNYSEDQIKTILLASSALPVLFDSEEIDGRYYYDGGLSDNAPVKPIYDSGYKIILVIQLSRDDVLDHNQFPDAQILEILPQDDQGRTINGTLDFTYEGKLRRIEQGYNDAVRILKPIYEMGLTQSKIKSTLHNLYRAESVFKDKRTEILKEREDLKTEIKNQFGV